MAYKKRTAKRVKGFPNAPAGMAGTPATSPISRTYNKDAPKDTAGGEIKNFQKRFAKMYPFLVMKQGPGLDATQAASAMGYQTQLAEIERDLAQYGLGSSPYAQYAMGGAQAGLTARDNAAMIQMYENAMGAGIEASESQYGFDPKTPKKPGPNWGALGASLASALIYAGAASSDKDLKTEIKPVRWKWNKKAERALGLKGSSTGLLAQDLEKVWPDTVIKKDGYRRVIYPVVAARLAGRVQEQGRTIRALEKALRK